MKWLAFSVGLLHCSSLRHFIRHEVYLLLKGSPCLVLKSCFMFNIMKLEEKLILRIT